MTYSAKTAKPRLFSTYIDAIMRAKSIKTDLIDFSDQDVQNKIESTGGIELWILEADGIIKAYLSHLYADSILRTTPWITPVIEGLGNTENSGTAKLPSVSLETTTAYTAAWKITITANAGEYWLLYDGESAAFSVDETAAGVGGGSGTVRQVVDNGTTGALLLSTVTGVYINDAALTSAAGAAVVNGTIGEALVFYDTQTGNFTVGQILTGVTSGATGTIVGMQDNGATGILLVNDIDGEYTDNESITDPITGAALANGNSRHAEKSATYDLYSSLEGVQGSGNQYTDFTSTNGDILIPLSAWSGIADDDDVFFFSVVDSQQMIWAISSKLAAAALIESIFQKGEPNKLDYQRVLRSDAMNLLDRLSRPFDKNGLRIGTSLNVSADSVWVDYHISMYGADDSSYLTSNALDY